MVHLGAKVKLTLYTIIGFRAVTLKRLT